jgi:cytochrome b6-f complex iron-sulfur subunit
VNRRDFLRRIERYSAAALGGAACVSLGTSCIGFHYVNSTVVGNRLLIRRQDFGSSPFVVVDAPGQPLPLYVYRLEDGGFSAVSTRCMHRGCQVEPAQGHLVCPCHGSEYTNTGEILKGPTQRPLRRFPVLVEDDAILIDLSGS